MPARAPLWEAVRITPIFRRKRTVGGGKQFEEVEGNAIQAEKFEARGGATISTGGGDGALMTRVRFKVRALALGGKTPYRIKEADGTLWEVDGISDPNPDMTGNRGARGIIFIETLRVGGNV